MNYTINKNNYHIYYEVDDLFDQIFNIWLTHSKTGEELDWEKVPASDQRNIELLVDQDAWSKRIDYAQDY